MNKLFLLALLVILAGCKAKKQQATAPGNPAVLTPAVISKSEKAITFERVESAQFNFKTLAIKAKADLSINNNSNNVSLSIRMKKDEAIWISITALAGLEVARTLITPDSIKIRNNLQADYMSMPFSYIHRFSNSQIDFNTLQALLTGNIIRGTLIETSGMNSENNQLQITGNLNTIVFRMLFNTQDKIVLNSLTDTRNNQHLTASYNAFQNISGGTFPFNVVLNSAAGNNVFMLNLKFNSVTVNEPVDFPFGIPKRFTGKD